MIVYANAKVNWTLSLAGLRPDGYHELDTVMLPVSLCDTLTVEESSCFTVVSDAALPENNNMLRAAKAYFAAAGLSGGVTIHAELKIPQMAGLGGSSADAGAVLRALDALYGALDEAALLKIARKIGSDVPFCFKNTASRCTGRGDVLSPFRAKPGIPLLLVKPDCGVSSGALFSALTSHTKAAADSENAVRLLKTGNPAECARTVGNALEDTAVSLVPEIGIVKKRLLDSGALGACMTGSGSCCFGVFESCELAQRAAAAFSDLPYAYAVTTV